MASGSRRRRAPGGRPRDARGGGGRGEARGGANRAALGDAEEDIAPAGGGVSERDRRRLQDSVVRQHRRVTTRRIVARASTCWFGFLGLPKCVASNISRGSASGTSARERCFIIDKGASALRRGALEGVDADVLRVRVMAVPWRRTFGCTSKSGNVHVQQKLSTVLCTDTVQQNLRLSLAAEGLCVLGAFAAPPSHRSMTRTNGRDPSHMKIIVAYPLSRYLVAHP